MILPFLIPTSPDVNAISNNIEMQLMDHSMGTIIDDRSFYWGERVFLIPGKDPKSIEMLDLDMITYSKSETQIDALYDNDDYEAKISSLPGTKRLIKAKLILTSPVKPSI